MAMAMAMSSQAHVVEIPVDSQSDPDPIHHHPLTEISLSSGHLLRLKLLQRQEDQVANRVGFRETRLDNLKHSAFYLSSLLFAFHGLFLTLLFTSSTTQLDKKACNKWWVPCCLSVMTSAAVIAAVQARVWGYWRERRGLARDRGEGRAIRRTMLELRMKGSAFDLDKDVVLTTMRIKSSSIGVELRPLRWMKENLVVICLVVFAVLVAPLSKFVLCL